MVLQNYDAIGRFLTVDDQGRPIDRSAPLPPSFGNQTVNRGGALSRAIAQNRAFTANQDLGCDIWIRGRTCI